MIDQVFFDNFPTFETERLLLRKLDIEDAISMQKIRSDERVMLYMDSERHTSLEHSQNFINENMKIFSEKKGMFWAIIEKSSNKFIGDFAFWKIDYKHSRAEIGYILDPEYWSKGLMKEAMSVLLKFGFQELNLHSLEANINPKNDKSRGILLSFKFKKEAYFRENYFYNGDYLDSEIYCLLESDLNNKI